MKHTYTPAPWKLFAVGRVISVESTTKTPIISWSGFDDSRRSLREHKANARLISAAPDLLEALKLMVLMCENKSLCDHEIMIMDQARSAIKKAEFQRKVVKP